MQLPLSFTAYFRITMSAKQLKSDPVKTMLVITTGMLIVYVVTKWEATLIIALVIGLIGVFSTYLSKKVEFLWMKLAWILSLIIPNILLTIIFYLLLTPIAFLSKLTGKEDPLLLKNKGSSTFKKYEKNFNADSFKNPW